MSPPPPVEVVNEEGTSPLVLLCEHASNFIPPEYDRLGVEEGALQRHIAWDPGAAAMARDLSRRLDASLFLTGYSRLLIDCNRPPGSETSIPTVSEDTTIPGNLDLPPQERERREAAYFRPFRDAVLAHLAGRARHGRPTVVIGVHSFTPIYLGIRRPWHAGILYAAASDLAATLLEGLRDDTALVVGDNEPYRVEEGYDHTVPVFGDGRGLPAVLLEVRQDLIAGDQGAAAWAARFEPILRRAAELHAVAERN